MMTGQAGASALGVWGEGQAVESGQGCTACRGFPEGGSCRHCAHLQPWISFNPGVLF